MKLKAAMTAGLAAVLAMPAQQALARRRADLGIGLALVTPGVATYQVNQMISIAFVVGNAGDRTALTRRARRVRVDLEFIQRRRLILRQPIANLRLRLRPGISVPVLRQVRVPALAPGQYRVRLRVDAGNLIRESNEQNNTTPAGSGLWRIR